jgi:hypothetical protein
MALIKAQHVAGKRYEWNLTEPDVHIRGNAAWIAYVNKGNISDASGTGEPELAGIGLPPETGRRWKIVFMHRARVPLAPPENDRKCPSGAGARGAYLGAPRHEGLRASDLRVPPIRFTKIISESYSGQNDPK